MKYIHKEYCKNPSRWLKTLRAAVLCSALGFAGIAATGQATAEEIARFKLTVSVNPPGAATVIVEPPMPPEGYEAGTIVSLKAAAEGTNVFSTWTGSLVDHGNPLVIEMTNNYTLRAVFNKNINIVWQNFNDRRSAAWLMNGTNILETSLLRNGKPMAPGWRCTGVGDFNGDAKTDLLFQHQDGRVAVWFMNGTEFLGSSPILNLGDPYSTPWRVVAAYDLNFDRSADILLQRHDGQMGILFMHGLYIFRWEKLLEGRHPGVDWKAVTVADFDDDWQGDILFQNSKRQLLVWFFKAGVDFTGEQLLRDGKAPAPGWNVMAAGDVDGDWLSDVLWQHDDGRIALWSFNRTDFIQGILLRNGKPVSGGWRVVGLNR